MHEKRDGDLSRNDNGTAPAATVVQPGWMPGILLVLLAIVPVFLPDAALWLLRRVAPAGSGAPVAIGSGERILRWSLSLVPVAVILHHALYLLYSRHRQFPTARVAPRTSRVASLSDLKDLYFGGGSIGLKYVVPLILAGALCSTMAAALLDVTTYSSWIDSEWGKNVHRAAALGFVGAYLCVILLLTQRAFRQDVTTGVALWTAAMFVVGPFMAGVFALFWRAPAGSSVGADVVYLVAGMLPRQFAVIAQNLAQRLMQPSRQPAPHRNVPLTTVRGITPDIEERLSEEGIFDVTTLAYADPYMLLQSTSFDRRQIVNWIDEALLITVFPDHWQTIEKNGFTGAMDLGWAYASPDLELLAAEMKMHGSLLKGAAQRLFEDPQVQDLYAVYWDDSGHKARNGDRPPPAIGGGAGVEVQLQPLVFSMSRPLSEADLAALLGTIGSLPDVDRIEKLDADPAMWRVYVRTPMTGAVRERLKSMGLSVA